ncbi:hypothetical protein BC941DRAFT_466733 [Chlamydoabsidia padenii]|nr:hypothetical protein BC941DRAFT_466733 [Chlamydoabsidia padenii]
MGKSKQQASGKGSLKPASSSRAVEANFGQTSSPLSFANLGGFAQFANPATTGLNLARPDTPGSDASDTADIDPELGVILKKINKRDSITKLKALEELDVYLNAHIPAIRSILNTWVTLYNKLVLEVDRRVRIAASNIHKLVCLHAKKKLAPYLKDLIGAWMLAMFDQSKDVANLATMAFECVFAEDKRPGVIVFCQKEILEYISEMLLVKTVETLSDSRYVSPDDMAAKYARVMASSLYTLTYLIGSLPEEDRLKAADDYNGLFDSTALWKFFTHESPVIRRAIYYTTKMLLVNWLDTIQPRLDMICPDFYANVFGDKDSSVHGDMWDALLLMTAKFPQSWIIISKKKPAVNKLYNFLRSGLNGSPSITYPGMLVLLANLPKELKDSPNFYKDVFTNFWKGLSSNLIDRSNSHHLINAYCECLVYFAITKSSTDQEISDYLVDVSLYGAIKTYFTPTKESVAIHEKMDTQCGFYLAKHMANLLKSNAQVHLEKMWSELETVFVQTVIDCKGPPGTKLDMQVFCQDVGNMLSCMYENLQPSETSQEAPCPTCPPLIGLVQRLFYASIESSLVHKDYTSELLTLASNLLDLYSAEIIREVDENKVSKQLQSLLSTVESNSVWCVVSVYVTMLSSLPDQTTREKWWQNVVTHLYELIAKEQDLQKMTVLASLLEQIELRNPEMNYYVKDLDNLIQQLSTAVLDHCPAVDMDKPQDLQHNQTLLGNVLTRIISLNLDRVLISEDTFSLVLASILSALRSFNQQHQLGHNLDQSINHQPESTILSTTKSVLRTILALLEPKNTSAAKLLGHPSLSDLPNQVFDAMFATHLEPSTSSLGNEVHHTTDDTIDDIRMLADLIWGAILNIISNSNLTGDALRTSFKRDVLLHLKNSLLDTNCLTSPSESIQRANKLLSTLYPDPCTLEYQQAVTTLIGNNTAWEKMYDQFREKRTLEYMASSITDRYAGLDDQILWEDEDELYPVQYDIYGLSSLGRLAVFTAAFIHGQGDIKPFFDSEKVKDIHDRDCLMRTLMLVSLECKQGLGMTGLSRIWKPHTPSTATATTALSLDVLTAGITNFIQQTNTIFDKWLGLVLENDSKTVSSTMLCSSLLDGLKNSGDIGNSRLVKFVYDCLMPHQYMDAYYASFIQLLMDRLIVCNQWTGKELEGWLPLMKAENEQVSPLTKCALITSFKQTIGELPSYRYLQGDLANKLSGSDGFQIFDDRPEAWQWLSILNSSTLQFGSLAIPPQRLMYLLNTVKGWFGQDYDDHLEVTQRKKVHGQMAILFDNICDTLQEVSGSQWDFFLDCVYEWISYNDANELDGLPLMYNSLRLLATLLNLAKDGNQDIADAIKEHWKEIGGALWTCFAKEKDIVLPLSQPRRRYQELLADILGEVPHKVLQSTADMPQVMHLLGSTNDALQNRAFFILKELIKEQTSNLSVQMEFSQSDDEQETKYIDNSLYQRLVNAPAISTWDITFIEEKELHEILGFMLSWLLMFEHFNDITFKLKQVYTSELKHADALDRLVPFLFKILNVGTGHGASPFDLTPWDCSIYELEGFDIMADTSYSLLAAHLYYQTLKHIPSLARSWWINHKNRVLVIAVEQYTEQHFSGLLISHEMELMNRPDIKQQLEENENEFKVRTLKANNEVSATYFVDEESMQISIKLPNNFPLQQISVEGVQKFGVKDKQWRGWMFAIAAVIGTQNGNIVDALTVFKRNVNLHFEGVGDCVICYSIISVVDRSLPKKQCRTCKNKFHASCLYKWFRSSNSASCPLCRTVF